MRSGNIRKFSSADLGRRLEGPSILTDPRRRSSLNILSHLETIRETDLNTQASDQDQVCGFKR